MSGSQNRCHTRAHESGPSAALSGLANQSSTLLTLTLNPNLDPNHDPNPNRQADLLAGLTVGVMTVPQALSYARIAGLPSEYGLYGAFTPVLAYAVFGSSPQLVRVVPGLTPAVAAACAPCRESGCGQCAAGPQALWRDLPLLKPASPTVSAVPTLRRCQHREPLLAPGSRTGRDHVAAAVQRRRRAGPRRGREHRPQQPCRPGGPAPVQHRQYPGAGIDGNRSTISCCPKPERHQCCDSVTASRLNISTLS